MADKTETEEPAPKSGGNMTVVLAVMFTGLLNTAAIGGLGYFLMNKMNAQAPATAGKPADGEKHAEGGEGGGEATAHGEGGGEATAHGEGGDATAGGGGHDTPVKRTGPPPQVHQLTNIVVRLKDIEREHHARISLSLEFKSTAEKATIEASLHRVREAAISYASDRRYDEMRGSRGMLDMKKQLKREARALFGEEFEELYVTEFVAQ
jgi:flagellar basal body-associated protein FliL